MRIINLVIILVIASILGLVFAGMSDIIRGNTSKPRYINQLEKD